MKAENDNKATIEKMMNKYYWITQGRFSIKRLLGPDTLIVVK
jgi:hypothetical protein